jgi:hypothetical protein
MILPVLERNVFSCFCNSAVSPFRAFILMSNVVSVLLVSHVPRVALSSFRCTACSKWAPALPDSPHRRPQPTDRPSDRPVNRSAGRSAGRSAAWLPGRSGDRGSGSLPANRKAPARLQSPGAHTSAVRCIDGLCLLHCLVFVWFLRFPWFHSFTCCLSWLHGFTAGLQRESKSFFGVVCS